MYIGPCNLIFSLSTLIFFFSVSTPQQRSMHGHKRTSSEIQAATGLDISLAQAFVAFLQTESSPKEPMKLPLRGDTPSAVTTTTEDLNSSHILNSSNASTSSQW